jgi:hypothetical protein
MGDGFRSGKISSPTEWLVKHSRNVAPFLPATILSRRNSMFGSRRIPSSLLLAQGSGDLVHQIARSFRS